MSSSNLVLLEHHHQLVCAIAECEDPALSRPIRSLLCAIATYFNVQAQCANPKRKSIAKRTDNYCPNHITALIRQAVSLGFLKVTPRFEKRPGDSKPRQVANMYEFALEKFGLYYSKFATARKKEQREKKNKTQAWESTSAERIQASDEAVRLAKLEYSDEHPDFDWAAWEKDHP